MKRRQAGFTLTELMVVVSIIGILATLAVVYMRPRVRPIDVATRVGDMMREAARRAIALGPVRANVAAKYGKARTQILAEQAQAEDPVKFTLWRLQEADDGTDNAGWIAIESYTTHVNVVPVNWAINVGNGSMPGRTPTFNVPPPPAPPAVPTAPTEGFVMQCRPNGTCDPRTLFFRAAISGPAYEQFARLSVMPIGGAINAFSDWN